MSEVKRAYDLMRGYVQREWDRISQVEWADASRELTESQSVATPEIPGDAPAPKASAAPTTERLSIEDQARRILGVDSAASFADIRKRYEKLNNSTDQLSAEPGSPDAVIADKLRSRVQWAYQVLVAKTDETERRFGSLEIE